MPVMKHKRILAIHDISCVGRCSLTVALPIISAAGIECSGLPTAVLSTHTGGFKGFTYRDLTEDMVPIDDHWKTLDLKFDAIYTGFLGSFEQIDIVSKLFDDLSDGGTTIYVDPVMADEGKLYSVFGPDFPAGMRKLCEKADVIMPNLTELCLMLGEEWTKGPYTREYICSMIEKSRAFGIKRIVITGVSFEEGSLGAVYKDFESGSYGECMSTEIPGYYHGTGDVFSSALVGACERSLPLDKAVEAAVRLTVDSIKDTYDSGEDVRYGVNFEHHLHDYIDLIGAYDDIICIREVSDDASLRMISSLGASIWSSTYERLLDRAQIDYMLRKFQSFEAISDQVSNRGYTYLLATIGNRPIGYCGYRPDGSGGMFLSKIYVLGEFHGKHISSMLLDRVKSVAKSKGMTNINLTVNRQNTHAVEVYKHFGFVVKEDVDTPIGEGFEMNDHIMIMNFRCSFQPLSRR